MTAVVLQDWEVHARFAHLRGARGRNRNRCGHIFGAAQANLPLTLPFQKLLRRIVNQNIDAVPMR